MRRLVPTRACYLRFFGLDRFCLEPAGCALCIWTPDCNLGVSLRRLFWVSRRVAWILLGFENKLWKHLGSAETSLIFKYSNNVPIGTGICCCVFLGLVGECLGSPATKTLASEVNQQNQNDGYSYNMMCVFRQLLHLRAHTSSVGIGGASHKPSKCTAVDCPWTQSVCDNSRL